MFANLTERFNTIFTRLKGRGALGEDDISMAMREIRIGLLEADVALPVVKEFIQSVSLKALGQDVLKSITPGQLIVKIVHDHLIELLGSDVQDLNFKNAPPVVILMTGLQASGKTTSTAKIAKFLQEKRRKKVLMVSVDVYRPAAQQQLEILGEQTGVATVPIVASEPPLTIAKRALHLATQQNYDVLLIDTAGRLHIDANLMQELEDIKDLTNPTEILLVTDAMSGQDAVQVAQQFQQRIGVTGIVMTRLDGDARGGAALSMRFVTQCPIKFVGVGEKMDALEAFDPRRIADRILDKGDVIALVDKAHELFDEAEGEKFARQMAKGQFDLNDFASQLQQLNKMGGMSGIMGMLPGVSRIKNQIKESGFDSKIITYQLAIIRSMTDFERRFPKVLNASRKRRIAGGSGRSVSEINRVLKQHYEMVLAMKKMNKLGEKGLKRHGLGALFSRHK